MLRGKAVDDANTYRIGHPLAERVVAAALALAPPDAEVTFDLTGSGRNIAPHPASTVKRRGTACPGAGWYETVSLAIKLPEHPSAVSSRMIVASIASVLPLPGPPTSRTTRGTGGMAVTKPSDQARSRAKSIVSMTSPAGRPLFSSNNRLTPPPRCSAHDQSALSDKFQDCERGPTASHGRIGKDFCARPE